MAPLWTHRYTLVLNILSVALTGIGMTTYGIMLSYDAANTKMPLTFEVYFEVVSIIVIPLLMAAGVMSIIWDNILVGSLLTAHSIFEGIEVACIVVKLHIVDNLICDNG
ncbi:hypothetical protein ACTXT7_004522 [Hymenolepis weldensis]